MPLPGLAGAELSCFCSCLIHQRNCLHRDNQFAQDQSALIIIMVLLMCAIILIWHTTTTYSDTTSNYSAFFNPMA